MDSEAVEKLQKERFEIAARFFESLAMTLKRTLRHCEEHSDEAISTFSTSPQSTIYVSRQYAKTLNLPNICPPSRIRPKNLFFPLKFTLDFSSLDFLSGVAKTKSVQPVKLVLSEVEWIRGFYVS